MSRHRAKLTIVLLGLAAWAGSTPCVHAQDELHVRLDRLQAEVERAEAVSAIKRLQRTYGYYVDKGMWADVAELFAEGAVANYPAGVYIGKESIRSHLFLNVGGVQMGETGLGDGRIYNHMNIQPVVHLDPGGETGKGRWRAFAMFGRFGQGATWAEGVYEMTYAKEDGIWKIQTLDYHSGFGASYATGWVPPSGPPRPRGPRNLPHPADRERNMPCEGFPAACLAPFHYDNPGTSDGGLIWTDAGPGSIHGGGNALERARALAGRASRLKDEQDIENLQRIYGYYIDRGLWGEAAALFANEGTIELGLQGIYVGPERIHEFLNLLGPAGGEDGWLNDHVQLQIVVSVDPGGLTAKSRSRELAMTGVHESHGEWSEGIYENTYVKGDGVWKYASLRFYPTFVADYDKGWTQDARPLPTVSADLPPDRPPTEIYEIFPKAHIPPYHYANPVTGQAPQYPREQGRPSRDAIRAATARVEPATDTRPARLTGDTVTAAVAEAERLVARVKDYTELENLQSAYGYYLDKNLWNDLADLFAENGTIELAQRGISKGRERVRGFLLAVFGRGGEGPVEGRLGNHVQWQPVIHVSPDGRSAKIRSRMLQQLNFGERASMGASIYENEAVKEDGRWKLSVDHTYNTWTAPYDGGWVHSRGGFVPGPSADYPPDGPPTFEFQMFPTVYDIPFHYRNPVTGRAVGPPASKENESVKTLSIAPGEDGGMPAAIAAELEAIGAVIDPPRTTAIYAALQPKEPYSGIAVARDLSYGPAERNVLDVFTSPEPGAGKPVVVFIHGGGFSRGAKHTPGSPFYDNVMLWAVAEGMVGVNINYRLAPEHMWPSGIEDLTALVAWLSDHVAEYGGDRNKVFLWGHSAGAAHVGDYVASRTLAMKPTGIAGAILTSGFYALGDEVSTWKAYYGDDVSTYAERSSLAGLTRASTPMFVSDAELDPPSFRPESRNLVEARMAAGKPVRYLHLLGHSHLSETYAVGTNDRSLSDPVLEFIQGLSP